MSEVEEKQYDLFGNEVVKSWENEWQGMPEFVQNDLQPYQKIVINFETKEDVDEFARLVKDKLSCKTNSIWFPAKEKDRSITLRYVEEETDEKHT